jgi:RNA polymerase sigma-70 factor (ECF subfamily)
MNTSSNVREDSHICDSVLILQIKKELPSKTTSFEVLTKRYHTILYSICLRIIGDSFLAEDAYQNTMLKIFRYIHQFQMNSSFKTWAYRIAFNESISLKQKYKYELESVRDYEAYEEKDNLDDALEIERVLLKVSEEERQILVLKYTVELSDKEIADIMDISLSALKMRLTRAKQKLQKFLS